MLEKVLAFIKGNKRLVIAIGCGLAAVLVLALGIGGVVRANDPVRKLEKYNANAQKLMAEAKADEALVEFKKALEIDPASAEAYKGMAEAYTSLQRYHEAEMTYDKAFEATGDASFKTQKDDLIAKIAPTPIPTPSPTPTPTPSPTPTPDPEEEETDEEKDGDEEDEDKPMETAPGVPASSAACVLTDAATIRLKMSFSSAPASDDGKLHIFQLAPYQYGLDGANEVGTAEVSANPEALFAKTNGAVDGLYCKYVFAAKQNGAWAMLGEPQYITNPELLATNTRARVSYPKKGLTDYFYNWNLDMGQGMPAWIMQINNYGYNGAMKHPRANQADSHMVDEGPLQYMFNASNADGVNTLAAAMKGVANMNGTQDYIIGNEVNVRKWCYIAYTDWDTYVREYMQGFRVAYNAIKSTNANARVFICLDQNWDRNKPANDREYYWFIDGKDFINKFNAQICAGGNIDWGLSFHPHPVPLTYAKFWDMGAIDPIYAQMVNSNAMVSFQNMSVITNYMTSGSLRSPSGAVRHMMASETGISANQGADVQGAALYASYQACLRNPYVDIMIYSFDDSTGARFTQRAWDVYNSMGAANEAETDAWAKSVIGISDWGQILR